MCIHQNGSLLRKCTYLSNDSICSVSFEDGVDITLLESSTSDDDKESLEYMHESSDSVYSSSSQCDANKVPSFTFETQVCNVLNFRIRICVLPACIKIVNYGNLFSFRI